MKNIFIPTASSIFLFRGNHPPLWTRCRPPTLIVTLTLSSYLDFNLLAVKSKWVKCCCELITVIDNTVSGGGGWVSKSHQRDNDLKTWGLIITPVSSQSEASIEVTWPDLTNQRPLRIILVNAPVPRPLTRLLLLWGKTKLICHNRSIRAIKRGMFKTLDYLSCFIEAAQFKISRMRTDRKWKGWDGVIIFWLFLFQLLLSCHYLAVAIFSDGHQDISILHILLNIKSDQWIN